MPSTDFLDSAAMAVPADAPADAPCQTGFDGQSPPDSKLIDACVHCGFCLSTCPSYRVLGTEMDSPRGRIYLMNAINDGQAPLTATTSQHFDSCLGCLACTTACPSGVRYDRLLSQTRPQVERNVPRSLLDRAFRTLLFQIFPYPNRLRLLLPGLYLYQRLGLRTLVRKTGLLKGVPRLEAMESVLPTVPGDAFIDLIPAVVPAQGYRRYRVGMFLGCVQRLMFSRVNQATARLLSANGCEVVVPNAQGCCGALPAHQGQEDQAQAIARQTIDAFDGQDLDYYVINAAGCGHTLKEYGEILKDDPAYRDRAIAFSAKVRDVHEFLAEVGLKAPLQPLLESGDGDASLAIVYQDACHLLHGQKIANAPRQLLRQIPGVTLREPMDAALCCGSAGVYNLLQPDIADDLGRQKVENLTATAADLIASPNPGCSLQIQKHLETQGKSVSVFHPVELLDFATRGVKLFRQ